MCNVHSFYSFFVNCLKEFYSLYIFKILKYLKLPPEFDRLRTLRTINRREITWTLGALLTKLTAAKANCTISFKKRSAMPIVIKILYLLNAMPCQI